mmetsp:Transcript_34018/g.71559  ORF Transcript_34018/g.71559 Transcript_34018/m.71559 type:complete len:491 (-) Transcript_34018:431-1903(-)
MHICRPLILGILLQRRRRQRDPRTTPTQSRQIRIPQPRNAHAFHLLPASKMQRRYPFLFLLRRQQSSANGIIQRLHAPRVDGQCHSQEGQSAVRIGQLVVGNAAGGAQSRDGVNALHRGCCIIVRGRVGEGQRTQVRRQLEQSLVVPVVDQGHVAQGLFPPRANVHFFRQLGIEASFLLLLPIVSSSRIVCSIIITTLEAIHTISVPVPSPRQRRRRGRIAHRLLVHGQGAFVLSRPHEALSRQERRLGAQEERVSDALLVADCGGIVVGGAVCPMRKLQRARAGISLSRQSAAAAAGIAIAHTETDQPDPIQDPNGAFVFSVETQRPRGEVGIVRSVRSSSVSSDGRLCEEGSGVERGCGWIGRGHEGYAARWCIICREPHPEEGLHERTQSDGLALLSLWKRIVRRQSVRPWLFVIVRVAIVGISIPRIPFGLGANSPGGIGRGLHGIGRGHRRRQRSLRQWIPSARSLSSRGRRGIRSAGRRRRLTP